MNTLLGVHGNQAISNVSLSFGVARHLPFWLCWGQMAAASGVSANLAVRHSGTDTGEEGTSKSANIGPSTICHVSIIVNKRVSKWVTSLTNDKKVVENKVTTQRWAEVTDKTVFVWVFQLANKTGDKSWPKT